MRIACRSHWYLYYLTSHFLLLLLSSPKPFFFLCKCKSICTEALVFLRVIFIRIACLVLLVGYFSHGCVSLVAIKFDAPIFVYVVSDYVATLPSVYIYICFYFLRIQGMKRTKEKIKKKKTIFLEKRRRISNWFSYSCQRRREAS